MDPSQPKNASNKVDSKFRLILLAAQRAEQLMRGSRPKVEVSSLKPSRIALREIEDGAVDWDYGPPPREESAVEEGVEESAGEDVH